MTITEDAAKLLKKNQLIEGRKPNYFISSEIASITNQKASYTKSKGLNKEILKSFILQHIDNHGYATREEIDELLLNKLPDYMDDKQRKKKLDNLLQEMKKDKIQNTGTRTFPKWIRIRKEKQ